MTCGTRDINPVAVEELTVILDERTYGSLQDRDAPGEDIFFIAVRDHSFDNKVVGLASALSIVSYAQPHGEAK